MIATKVEMESSRPEGTTIIISKITNSTTHLEIKYDGGNARVFLDDDERESLIAALVATRSVR